MRGLSVVHWTVVVIAALLLFGGGRVSRSMEEIGQGIRALRKGLAEEPAKDLSRPTE